ncbi:hypothetical protein BDD12DRAFT_166573 [Trichophaea hybrida]|nr:hypothetical protein BDD12DRAFT_166573 [Trichophaea hybrida]
MLWIILIYLCFLTLATPLPPQKKPSKLCPITSRGILNVRPLLFSPSSHTNPLSLQFDDAPPGFLSTYQNFTFPGTVDWYIISSSPSNPIPVHKGVTSPPHGLLSSFHWMTTFTSSTFFTFDLVSLNITALTTTARNPPLLKVKIYGSRVGEEKPRVQKSLVVRNAFGDAGAVFIGFDAGWRGLETVGIEVVGKEGMGVPKPGEVSPGFVLDDVVYVKRGVC